MTSAWLPPPSSSPPPPPALSETELAESTVWRQQLVHGDDSPPPPMPRALPAARAAARSPSPESRKGHQSYVRHRRAKAQRRAGGAGNGSGIGAPPQSVPDSSATAIAIAGPASPLSSPPPPPLQQQYALLSAVHDHRIASSRRALSSAPADALAPTTLGGAAGPGKLVSPVTSPLMRGWTVLSPGETRAAVAIRSAAIGAKDPASVQTTAAYATVRSPVSAAAAAMTELAPSLPHPGPDMSPLVLAGIEGLLEEDEGDQIDEDTEQSGDVLGLAVTFDSLATMPSGFSSVSHSRQLGLAVTLNTPTAPGAFISGLHGPSRYGTAAAASAGLFEVGRWSPPPVPASAWVAGTAWLDSAVSTGSPQLTVDSAASDSE
ncbi:hypothetical protein HK405_013751 [Cladochytrium tenue]|nr:hypothetical protein HK405_013751 [Cladochytrium tenue]